MGVTIKRIDLQTLFGETDYIIQDQEDYDVKENRTLIKVICSDTDVFMLLCITYIV